MSRERLFLAYVPKGFIFYLIGRPSIYSKQTNINVSKSQVFYIIYVPVM